MKPPTHFAARFIILLLCLPILTTAQNGSLPETLFGARGLSLGRSAVVSSHDALFVSWNPAGVTNLKKITLSAARGNLVVADASHSSFGLVVPTKKFGYFGLSYYQNKTVWLGGLEYSYQSTIALRTGWNDSQFSAGLGLQFKNLTLITPAIIGW